MSQKIYLSLGSNLGDRESHLRLALDRLQSQVHLDSVSSVYETDPVGVVEQPPFLNQAVAGETGLSPNDLLRFVKDVEAKVGRRPTFHWGPRVIDIDVLLYGARIVKTDDLEIPHPRIAERAFVLIPLAEIAPAVMHPVQLVTMSHLACSIHDRAGVRVYTPAKRSSRQGSPSE